MFMTILSNMPATRPDFWKAKLEANVTRRPTRTEFAREAKT